LSYRRRPELRVIITGRDSLGGRFIQIPIERRQNNVKQEMNKNKKKEEELSYGLRREDGGGRGVVGPD